MKKEGNKKEKRSRLGKISLILSFLPIIFIILYGGIRTFLISSIVFISFYGYLVNFSPYVAFIFSGISLYLIKKKNLNGFKHALIALIISIIEIILFYIIVFKQM